MNSKSITKIKKLVNIANNISEKEKKEIKHRLCFLLQNFRVIAEEMDFLSKYELNNLKDAQEIVGFIARGVNFDGIVIDGFYKNISDYKKLINLIKEKTSRDNYYKGIGLGSFKVDSNFSREKIRIINEKRGFINWQKKLNSGRTIIEEVIYLSSNEKFIDTRGRVYSKKISEYLKKEYDLNIPAPLISKARYNYFNN